MRGLLLVHRIGAALCLVALLAIVPTPLLGQGEWIDLDPESGSTGDNVRVTGEDFNPSYEKRSGNLVRVYVRLYFSCDAAETGDSIGVEVRDYEIVDNSERVDKNGEWRVSFTVPAWLRDGEEDQDVEGGTYYLYVTYKGDDEIVAVEEYDVRGIDLRWSRWWSWHACSPSWCDCWPSLDRCDDWCDCYDRWYYYPPCPWPDDCFVDRCIPYCYPWPPVTDWECRP